MRKLTKIEGKTTSTNSKFELLCAAADMSQATYYHKHTTSGDVQVFEEDWARLLADKEWRVVYI